MDSIGWLRSAIEATLQEWRDLRLRDLVFGHGQDAVLVLTAVAGIALAILVARAWLPRPAGRQQIALPALLQWAAGSRWSFVRFAPQVICAAALPFFALALADPFLPLSASRVTYPGRRIALLIDASASMTSRFEASTLNPNDTTAFLTTVGAADFFVKQRIKGGYRDLIGLVEFGDRAYVITPFTTDYENLLLSLSLVGSLVEFVRFPNQGTTIALAIEESIGLFRTFNFLDATGNIMVIFTDGQDTQYGVGVRSLDEILDGATRARVPVYFIRTAYNRQLGGVIPDAVWKPAVEKTGGRFYAAANEADIIRAIYDIDRLAAGQVEVRQYTTQLPRFAPFALVGVALWMVAASLKLLLPGCRRLP